ncbi:MAG: hypothetical protein QOK35_2292 [Pseudonocardiales bacterium]|jgi:hypothetical protein|nr:hypothetical protein [Pseudonocardiales bacterium]
MKDDGGTGGRVHEADRSWFGRRVGAWSVVVTLAVAVLGATAPHGAPTAQVRLTAASTATDLLTSDERALLALMDPKDRARFLLQKRLAEQAETAAMLSNLQAIRHEAALSVIRDIR